MKPALSLACTLSPPLAQAGQGANPVHALISLEAGALGPPLGIELKVGRVCPTDRGLPVLADTFRAVADGMGARDSLIFAGRHSTGVARAGPEPAHALRSPWPDLAGAFHGVASLLGGMDEGRLVWVILVVETAVTEAGPATIQALQSLVEHGAGVDLICTHPAADLGLLSRLAQRTGGEVIQASAAEVVEKIMKRIALLRDQRVRRSVIEIRTPRAVSIQRVFRAEPLPTLVGMPAPAAFAPFTLPVGPIAAGRPHSWLVSATVHGRRPGRFRLFDVKLRYEVAQEKSEAGAAAWQRHLAEPPRMIPVEGAVNAALNRVETAAWIEEIARAHQSGDARRVAGLLDRLVRHAVTFDDRGLVTRAFELRLAFLRSGVLEPSDINALRRHISG